MTNNKKKTILIFCILFLILCFTFCLIFNFIDDPTKSDGIIWNGRHNNQHKTSSEYISIPGFDSIHFEPDQKVQKVNFFNPESNNCYMIFTLVVGSDVIWQSDKVYPGYGFYEIETNKSFKSGTYNAILKINCFNIESDKELNGGQLEFNIYV